MENISIIAAVGKNGELGKDNNLIWHLKGDLPFFKQQTMGKPVVMGMNTFRSLPKLLPGRKHIVLTRKFVELDPSVLVVHSMGEAMDYIKNYEHEVMIIGGARVYSEFIDEASKLYLTEVDAEEKTADCYFPEFDHSLYERTVIDENKEGIPYQHVLYLKKK